MRRLNACLCGALALPVLLLAIATAGCRGPNTQHVVALSNQEIVALDADDMVRIMRRSGFSDAQILDLGTDLRNALAATGAAEVRMGKKIEAMFAADEHCLYGSTRTRGSFIYDLDKRAFR